MTTSTTTTAIANSFKVEILCAGHCFLPTYTPAASAGTSGSYSITGLTGVGAGTYATPTFAIVPGMAVTGTSVGISAFVGRLLSQTSVTVDVANAGTVTSGSVVFTGDTFKIALVVNAGSGSISYGSSTTNVGTPGTGTPSQTNLGTDEVANGSGYTSGGVALSANVMPTLSSSTATTQWTGNPQWTSASFTCIGGIIYNNSPRMGAPANGITANLAGSAINRVVSVHDFGGSQTVSAGTLTLSMPTNNSSTALLRIA